MSNIVEELSNSFSQEALDSPLLFNDLANMEKYVAESYSGRSLIELLQNADDAGAQEFCLKQLDTNKFLVANNGRVFNNDDIVSLCRSGASTKKRKSGTIGYRGIGFKSVVNYANEVELFSGNIRALFSKERTKELLHTNRDVPLIRVPHKIDMSENDEKVEELIHDGYTTVFVFETHNDTWISEVKDFDSSCFLFLKNLSHISLITEEENSYWCERIPQRVGVNVNINKQQKKEQWLVVRNENITEECAIAFKYVENQVSKADHREAVIHSFMPTLDKLSIPLKINGDFSTDPSRTRVTVDDETMNALEHCADIISNLFSIIWKHQNDILGILPIIADAKIDPLYKIKGKSVNDMFVEILIDKIKRVVDKCVENKKVFLQPEGITDEDFYNILEEIDAKGITINQERKMPGLFKILNFLGIEELPSNLALQAMKKVNCEDATKTAVVVSLIKENKLGFSNDLKKQIREAKIFRFESGEDVLEEVEKPVIASTFEGAILESDISPKEWSSFAKTFDIQVENKLLDAKKNDHVFNDDVGVKIVENVKIDAKKEIKKWRSAEKNVAAILELSDNVEKVIDVSLQNLGYDLEAVLIDGSKRYYEVKSVGSLHDSFSITNNEYTVANVNRDNYYLAIANEMENTIQVCFIKNPIQTLGFTRRVTRWEWLCEEYTGEVVEAVLREK